VLKLGKKKKTFATNRSSEISIKRRSSGIAEIWANDEIDMAFAQAYAHCTDRFLQMFLLRIIGKGRLCELLKDDEDSLQIDIFMRQMNFYGSTEEDLERLPKDVLSFFESYADGVNKYLNDYSKIWEFKLLGVDLEPWSPRDSLMVVKIMSYIGLAQTQQDAEKLIIQLIRNKLDLNKIKDLFSPHLDGLSQDICDQLGELTHFAGLIPEEVKFHSMIPKILASNNWILAGSKTESGNVIQCNDPHLEINRLPAIWYEQIVHYGERNIQGFGMPGLPGVIMGRTDHVSYGFTYGFMDMIDYFIEDVTSDKYLRDEEHHAFKKRKEIIKRKKTTDFELNLFENHCGTLETPNDSSSILKDGKYLNRAWSADKLGSIGSAIAMYEMLFCDDVPSLKDALSKISISCNWLLGDDNGDIAFQQSGLLPKRTHSGLYPLEAKHSKNLWNGVRDRSELISAINPKSGFLASANNDLLDYKEIDKPLSINLPMGSYRFDRICDLLKSKQKHSLEDMKTFQRDLYSLQAEKFMPLLTSVLGQDTISEKLKSWDLRYNKESFGAVIFENFYHNLLREVFAKDFIGTEAFQYIENSSSILIDFYSLFDRILLGDDKSLWFKNKNIETCLRNAYEQTLKFFSVNKLITWGELRVVPLNNILFDGNLPSFLGFDYGPISIEGSRATVVQGALYEAHGRISTFCPSMRFITDLGQRKSYTMLAGGVSDRRFSKYYTSEIAGFLKYEYKEVKLD